MFFGEYRHRLDEKGRVAIPARFRDALKRGAVVTRGLDTSLFLFPKEEWDKLAKRLASLPLGRATSRALSRLMLAGAMEVDVDKQGRVGLPDYLRHYSGIRKEIVFAGVFDRIELWDPARWESYKRSAEKDSGNIAEQLGELGL
ncbi:division/cell wall cluster transcriptional repressor MraZ [Candidatus Uhrbacteria bacterium]|nr:division/cell wall cluster transcriptional repressor MraZ [Candidatus Uhrbacteria bacterium]